MPLICPKHQKALIDVDDPQWHGRLKVCPDRRCGYNQLLPPRKRQMKLPGLDPGRQSVAVPDISEKALVRQVVQWGGLLGYEILEIGQHVHYLRCPSCKATITEITCPRCQEEFDAELPSQSTPGAPDTFWHHPDWAAEMGSGNWWRGIEAKKNERAAVRPEQQRLADLGYIEIAWALEMFQAILKR